MKIGIGIWLWAVFICLAVGYKETLYVFVGIPAVYLFVILPLAFLDEWRTQKKNAEERRREREEYERKVAAGEIDVEMERKLKDPEYRKRVYRHFNETGKLNFDV